MGAIAEAFAAFAQPLIDKTDGSLEQVQNAFTLSQLCYNLALCRKTIGISRSEKCRKPSGWMTRNSTNFSVSSSFP